MKIDYHCHLLPGMDDGAENLSESRRMMSCSFSQGVRRIVATPHYYPHRESIPSFLGRRLAAYREALTVLPSDMSLIPGAEVYLEKGLSAKGGLDGLAIGNGPYILLELPYLTYMDWAPEEVHNIACHYHLTPILAHIERYLDWYAPEQMEQLLSVPGAVLQCNCESLEYNKALKWILFVISRGRDVVFGTDAHNMSSRPPNMNLVESVLKPKVDPMRWHDLLRENNIIIESPGET